MCSRILPEAINSRLIQPKLRPVSPPAVLVMTRPCQAGETATLPWPLASLSTMSSVCSFRKEASSPKLAARTPSAKATRETKNTSAMVISLSSMAMRLCLNCGAGWERRGETDCQDILLLRYGQSFVRPCHSRGGRCLSRWKGDSGRSIRQGRSRNRMFLMVFALRGNDVANWYRDEVYKSWV